MNRRRRAPRTLDRAVRAATLVLVADASDTSRALVCRVVEERGYTPVQARDGEEAWRAWERERPALVLLDANLPSIDGAEVSRRIRAADPRHSTFVIALAEHDGTDLERMLDAGADDYLSKPPSADRVRARLTIAERRILLEEQRLAAEAELARARWQEGIGETTTAVEHEINNPLAALIGYAAMLEKSPTLTPEDRAQVSIITEQAERIASVVKRLSKLKNPQSVEYLQGSKMIDLSHSDGDEDLA
jgi:DNA-binding response OmpR family regulator